MSTLTTTFDPLGLFRPKLSSYHRSQLQNILMTQAKAAPSVPFVDPKLEVKPTTVVTIPPVYDPVVDQPGDLSKLMQSRVPPPLYVVRRGHSGPPELLNAASDEEAKARIQKEVRAGQVPVVYCYKLWLAEEFTPSSNTLDLEAILAKFPPLVPGMGPTVEN